MALLGFEKLAAGALALTATLSIASSARADDVAAVGLTIFISATLSARPTVGLGTDFRVAVLASGKNDDCGFQRRSGAGPFAQVTWLIPSGARFTFGGHGGGELKAREYSVEGEAAWTYRTAMNGWPGGNGILVGLTPLVFPVSASAQALFSSYGGTFTPEATVAIGGGFPQLFGAPVGCVEDEPGRGFAARRNSH